MKFETQLSCGDKAWIYYGRHYRGVQEATIGQIRIEFTDCIICDSSTDYEPEIKKEYKEVYMCQETGIGSGTLHTYGESIFKTREECEAAFAEHIAKQVEKKRVTAEYEREKKLGNEALLRMQLAEIEQLKLEKQ